MLTLKYLKILEISRYKQGNHDDSPVLILELITFV